MCLGGFPRQYPPPPLSDEGLWVHESQRLFVQTLMGCPSFSCSPDPVKDQGLASGVDVRELILLFSVLLSSEFFQETVGSRMCAVFSHHEAVALGVVEEPALG